VNVQAVQKIQGRAPKPQRIAQVIKDIVGALVGAQTAREGLHQPNFVSLITQA